MHEKATFKKHITKKRQTMAKGTVFFFYSWKRKLSCHFRSKLSEWVKMVYFFFRFVFFFTRCRILRGWWDLDQLRHFSRKKLKNRLQTAQNKCIRFCLKQGDRTSIRNEKFKKINWLPIQDRFEQCILSSVYKFHNKSAPDYMNEIFLMPNVMAFLLAVLSKN